MTAKDREMLLKDSQLADCMVDDIEAAQLLKISVKTLQNKVSAKTLNGLFTTSPINGKRFWIKSKIVGL